MDLPSIAIKLYEIAKSRSVRHGIWCCRPMSDDPNRFCGWVIPPLALDDEYAIFANGQLCPHVPQPDGRQHVKDIFDRFQLTGHQNCYTFSFRLPSDSDVTRLECRFGIRPLPKFHQSYFWPRTFDIKTPAINMRRVTGSEDYLLFKLTGYTEYRHISKILLRHMSRSANRLKVLDWGCGSARVLRHFLNDPCYDLTGVEIDSYNLDYCVQTFGSLAKWRLIHPLEPLPFRDETFDAIYGISVFTHLSQKSEQFWLRELKRVSKPGAIVIASVHGETAFFKDVNDFSVYVRLMEEGFVDLGHCADLDGAGAVDDVNVYRNVLHSEAYIHRCWGQEFAILDYISAGSPGDVTAHQDYVVMQRRG